MTSAQDLIGLGCGGLVGLMLALTGGGGSLLAVPMLLYVVGVDDPHLAIGTSAFAVSVNAWLNLVPHARRGNVAWRDGAMFAAAGVVGAIAGSTIGKRVDGSHLMVAFALVMIVVAVLMLRSGHRDQPAALSVSGRMPRLFGVGLGAGGMSGFFGIGGGFLVVPGLMLASRMTILNAIGTSLVAVGAFGLTTAINYSASGWVDWPLAFFFIGGGVIGGIVGAKLAVVMAQRRGALNILLATVILSTATYTLVRSFSESPSRVAAAAPVVVAHKPY